MKNFITCDDSREKPQANEEHLESLHKVFLKNWVLMKTGLHDDKILRRCVDGVAPIDVDDSTKRISINDVELTLKLESNKK